MPTVELVLASASPRRLALLRSIGLSPVAHPSGAREDVDGNRSPADLVTRLAEIKGRSVAKALGEAGRDALVLAADTAVVLGSRVLGKPADADDAARMLRALRDRAHEVLTGMFVVRTDDGRAARAVERTTVRFRDYDERLVRWYAETGEPLDKAGAYGIQGGGALFLRGVEGSWSNVVGLPLERLPALLEAVGVDLVDLLAAS